MSNSTNVDWRASYIAMNEVNYSWAELAAYLTTLRCLPSSNAPDWTISTVSDGSNAIGIQVPNFGIGIGNLTLDSMSNGAIEWPTGMQVIQPFPRSYLGAVCEKIVATTAAKLDGSAYASLIARATSLCTGHTHFHDILAGPNCEILRSSLIELHQSSRIAELHEALVAQDKSYLNANKGFVSSVKGRGTRQAEPKFSAEVIVHERKYCDTVFSLQLNPITLTEFSATAQLFRDITGEFRKRIWERGGVYGAGLEYSITNRMLSWWTTLDHDPLSTFETIKTILGEKISYSCEPNSPERSLAFLPPSAPGFAQAISRVESILKGYDQSSRQAVIDAEPLSIGPTFWKEVIGNTCFVVCGPEALVSGTRIITERGSNLNLCGGAG